MIFTGQEPIEFNDPLPGSVDVVIVGAGVAGISTAWFLSQRGLSVFIVEKGRVACEQSSRNWGWVRQQGRDAAELPIMMDAIRSWDDIDRTVGAGIGFKRHGVMYLASNDQELEDYARWQKIAEPYQLDTRMLGKNEVEQTITGQQGHWVGAIYTPSDGRAEPFTAVPSIARYLHGEQGVGLRENCAARCLDIQAGQIVGVVTEHGTVKAGAVLLCGGAWSSRFLRNHGVDLPQLTVRSTVARTEPVESFYEGNAATSQFAFRRRQDGGYTLAPGGFSEHYVGADSFRYLSKFLPVLKNSAKNTRIKIDAGFFSRLFQQNQWGANEVTPFEETRVLNPEPSPAGLAHLHREVDRVLPGLRGVPFAETWAGMIDVTPDVVPVMDKIDRYPGLFVGTGFSGHGFGFGPGAGKVLANLIMGQSSEFDLSRFRFSRFSDGSKMVPGPGL